MAIKTNLIYRGDCYNVLKKEFPKGSNKQGVNLIYIDPPFSFDPEYARQWYDKETRQMFEEMTKGKVEHYTSWISKRLEQCHRVLKDNGSIYLHCDWKFGHYIKTKMDDIFKKDNFQNELIWYYQTGGASKKRFSRKHDNIFFYTKGKEWVFNSEDIKIRRTEKAIKRAQTPKGARIKAEDIYKNPDDVLSIPQMNPMAKERIRYSTQKPESLLEIIIKASSNPGDIVLDPMCGCGTTIVVAHKLGRKWIGIDVSSQACEIMKKRMESLEGITDIEIRGLPLTMKDLRSMEPREFEKYLCKLTDSRHVGKKGDKGIDGYYKEEIPIQIKHQEKVGRNTVDNFETALKRARRNRGFIIGFSFTKDAHDEVARAENDGLNIELVEMEKLLKRDYELEDFK